MSIVVKRSTENLRLAKQFSRAIMLIIFIVNICSVWAFDASMVLKNIGEKSYRSMMAKSNLPIHGECWRTALKTIGNDCRSLNDNEHSLLALKLSNCFLKDSGHTVYNCHLTATEIERRECINNMSDRAFGVYNEFYTHATHICFFLNQELWHTETRNTIELLHRVSSHMKEQLLQASEMQGIMLESQKQGLKIQNELLDHGKELGGILKSSAETVNNMVVDFKETAKSQKELLYQIFSYMHNFQTWIIGEVSWFQSIIYYVVSCILCALFTSSKRTANTRIQLFTILSFNIILERMLVQYYNKTLMHTTEDKVTLVEITWLIRKIALTVCAVTLFYTYYFYIDEHMESNKALRRIENQLTIMRESNYLSSSSQPIRYSKRLAMKRLQGTPLKDT